MKPRFEALEARDLPSTVTVVWDIDSGSSDMPRWYGNYNLPARDLGGYMAGEISFLSPTPTFPGFVDETGYGGHGSIMSALLAAELEFTGQAPVVVSCVACDAAGFHTDAIGRAEATIAAVARLHPDWRNVVTLPTGPGAIGIGESRGRAALASAGAVLIESAGNGGARIGAFGLPTGPGALVASAVLPDGTRPSYSNYGGVAVPFAIRDAALGTSGAAIEAGAEAARIWTIDPGLTAAQVVAELKR